jgi:hypothetical protein
VENKFPNLTKIFGKNPEKLDRKEFYGGLESYYQKLKKQYKDPVIAKNKLDQYLSEAATLDFAKTKDINKLPDEVKEILGFTEEEKEKTPFSYIKRPAGVSERLGGETSRVVVEPAPDVMRSPEERERLKQKLTSEYYSNPETIEKLRPEVTIYNDPKTHVATSLHEGLHALQQLRFPYTEAYRTEEDVESKGLNLLQKEAIKKDPSLRNVELQSGTTTHFQPLYVSNPPTPALQEAIFNKLNPYISKPEIIAPEQPEATGIFKEEEKSPENISISNKELNDILYNLNDKETFDPLRKNKFEKIENLFKEVKPEIKVKKVLPKKEKQMDEEGLYYLPE